MRSLSVSPLFLFICLAFPRYPLPFISSFDFSFTLPHFACLLFPNVLLDFFFYVCIFIVLIMIIFMFDEGG